MKKIFRIFDYSTPGKGVEKDESKSNRILLFFQIYFRKIGKLIGLNLMFSVFNLPAFLVSLMAFEFLFTFVLTEDVQANYIVKFMIGIIFLFIPVLTFGPAQAGFTYVLRNFAREEHAWVWHDFKQTALKNFKQSLIISIINLFIFLGFGFSINYYFLMAGSNFTFQVVSGFLIFCLLLFLMMNMYIYPILVTFSLTIKQVYKNALIFALAKFFRNLVVLIICSFIAVAPFGINPYLAIYIMMPIFSFSFIGLITNFYVQPSIKKYMIDKVEDSR